MTDTLIFRQRAVKARPSFIQPTCDDRHSILAAMAILVDRARWPFRGRMWAHLVSDESFEELHDFAERLGIPRRGFQGDHYDVPEELRRYALSLGAVPVPSSELVRRLRAKGLRKGRREGSLPGF